MSNALIRVALESRLLTWARARSPALPVAIENVSFTPPSDVYLRAFLLPADTSSEDLAGKYELFQGVFQVSVVVPAGGGMGTASQIENELKALFPTNLIIQQDGQGVMITTPMSAAPPVSEPDMATLPVSCRYRLDLTS